MNYKRYTEAKKDMMYLHAVYKKHLAIVRDSSGDYGIVGLNHAYAISENVKIQTTTKSFIKYPI